MSEATKSLFDVMEDVAQLPRSEARRLYEEVRANSAKLASCEGPHRFTPHERYNDKPDGLIRTEHCDRCQGTVSRSDALWYKEGLRDAHSLPLALVWVNGVAVWTLRGLLKPLAAYAPAARSAVRTLKVWHAKDRELQQTEIDLTYLAEALEGLSK